MKWPLTLTFAWLLIVTLISNTSSLSLSRQPGASESEDDLVSDQEVCWDIRADDNTHAPCVHEGFFLKPHSNCRSYYRCVKIGKHMHSFEFDCGEGSVFDLEESFCLPVAEAARSATATEAEEFLFNCTGTTKAKHKKKLTKRDLAESSSSEVTDSKLQETISMLNRKKCRSETDVFEHPTDCSQYITCLLIDGQLHQVQVACPAGEMFDEFSVTLSCVNPTSMSTKAQCFPEAEKLIEALLHEKVPEVDPGEGDGFETTTSTAVGSGEYENGAEDNYGHEESLEEPDVDVKSSTASVTVNETVLSEGAGKTDDDSSLTPSFVLAFFSHNHEIAIMICILLFLLLITTCFFCCYMLRSIYHCVFLKSPAKARARSRLSSGSARNSRRSSRSGSSRAKASGRGGGGSIPRFLTSTTNFLDSDPETEKGAIELKRVKFITSEHNQDSFPPPPPPHQCSTFEIRAPQQVSQLHGTSLIQGSQGQWHFDHNTTTTTTTDVIVNVNHPRQCHVEKAVAAGNGTAGKRKKVEIYIPNLNLPNAVEPLYVRTFFGSEDLDRLDTDMNMDENYFSIMESKELKFGNLDLDPPPPPTPRDEDDEDDYVVLPDAIYDAVIPKSQRNIVNTNSGRVAHISPFKTTAMAARNSDGGDDTEEKNSGGEGEKRLSSFGKPLNSVQENAMAMEMTAGQNKKSSIIVMDQLEDGRVLEYFF